MDQDPAARDPLTNQVLAAVFEIANTLGAGFLEKVYERALMVELTLRGIPAKSQAPIPVTYKGHPVGDYYADILVDNTLILELKCAEAFSKEHVAQSLNYLRASGIRTCLLINFQRPKVEWKRLIL